MFRFSFIIFLVICLTGSTFFVQPAFANQTDIERIDLLIENQYLDIENIELQIRNQHIRIENQYLDLEKTELQIENLQLSNINSYIESNSKYHDELIEILQMETRNKEITCALIERALIEDVPITLIFAIAYAESNYNPKTISSNKTSKDYGLLQLNNKSFPKYTKSQLLHLDTNIRLGTQHLSFLLKNFTNDPHLAIASYNAGLTSIKNKRIPWSTFNYVAKVLEKSKELELLIYKTLKS